MKKFTHTLTALLLLSVMLSGCTKAASAPENSETGTVADVPPEKGTVSANPVANPASDFSYRETEDGGIRINWYLGTDPHVVIPDRIDQKPVVRIGSSAFTACAPVISVTMPDTVTVIEEKAFFGCNTLETITFSKSLAEIQAEAFAECDSLRHIRIPASVQTIGNMAFYNAWVETLEFEDGIRLETISYLSFSGTALKRLKLPDSVRTLEYGAFSNSHFLTEVELNEGLTSIGSGAFYGVDRLKEIVIPKTVTEVTEMEFDGCFALRAIYFDGNAPETFEYRNEISGLQKPSYGGLRLTIYYHEGATGFAPSLWYGYPTAIW